MRIYCFMRSLLSLPHSYNEPTDALENERCNTRKWQYPPNKIGDNAAPKCGKRKPCINITEPLFARFQLHEHPRTNPTCASKKMWISINSHHPTRMAFSIIGPREPTMWTSSPPQKRTNNNQNSITKAPRSGFDIDHCKDLCVECDP